MSEATSTTLKDNKWFLDDAVVKQCIASTVSDSIFNRIKHGENAQEIWKLLTRIYQARSRMVAVDLRSKMGDMVCDKKDDVRSHFDSMDSMRESLAPMGMTLTDDEYTTILL